MQRIANLLSEFNTDLTKTYRLHQAWKEIAGEVLAAHTEPVHLKAGTLTIICDAPLWAQQVQIMSASLCQQVKTIVGFKVKKCEGRFGQVRRPQPFTRQHQAPMKPAIDPRVVEGIKDPELKRRIEALLAIQDGSSDG